MHIPFRGMGSARAMRLLKTILIIIGVLALAALTSADNLILSAVVNEYTYPVLRGADVFKILGKGFGKVLVDLGDGAFKVVSAKDVQITDVLGNKPKLINDHYVPKEHIPDLRVYDTRQINLNNYTIYMHDVNYGSQKLLGGGVVTGGPEDKINPYEFFDPFLCLYLKDPEQYEKDCSVTDHRDLGDGFTLDCYEIKSVVAKHARLSEYAIPGLWSLSCLQVLKDHGKLVWASTRDTFAAVERRGDSYIVITDCSVEYISREDGHVIDDYYEKKFCDGRPYGNVGTLWSVAEAKMLTDNIVRIVYKPTTPKAFKTSDTESLHWVAHWRVRLTKEDVDKNYKKPSDERISNEDQKACGSLIWSSRKIFKENYFRLAWDYDSDTSAEPVYDK